MGRYRRRNGSLSNSVFERRTSTGSGLFTSLGSGLVETLGRIGFIREKKLSNTNLLESRHILRGEKTSLPVDVAQKLLYLNSLMSFSNDDGDGNENGKKAINRFD